MTDANSVNQPSTGNDFQPPTGNPQSLDSSNLQVPVNTLQPNDAAGLTAEQLYRAADSNPNLKVEVAQGSADSSTAVPATPATTQTNTGVWLGLGVLGILIALAGVGFLLWRRRTMTTGEPAVPAQAPMEVSKPKPAGMKVHTKKKKRSRKKAGRKR